MFIILQILWGYWLLCYLYCVAFWDKVSIFCPVQSGILPASTSSVLGLRCATPCPVKMVTLNPSVFSKSCHFSMEKRFFLPHLSLSFAFLHFLKTRSAHTLLKSQSSYLRLSSTEITAISHLHLTWPFFWIPLWTLMCYDSLVFVGFVPPFSRFGFLLCSTGSSRTLYEYQVGSDLWWSSCLCLQRLELQAGVIMPSWLCSIYRTGILL